MLMNQVNPELKQGGILSITESKTLVILNMKTPLSSTKKTAFFLTSLLVLALISGALYAYLVGENNPVKTGIAQFKQQEYPQAYAALYSNREAVDFNAEAAYSLASIYYNGYGGISIDHVKALKWFEEAAKQQHTQAQFYTGMMYLKGLGDVPKDALKAVKWLGVAAFQEEVAAQFYLGKMHYEGKIVGEAVYSEAFSWFEKAAEQEYPEALYYLGQMHWQGQGVGKDAVKAIQYYAAAAEQGFPLAQQTLAQLNEQITQ